MDFFHEKYTPGIFIETFNQNPTSTMQTYAEQLRLFYQKRNIQEFIFLMVLFGWSIASLLQAQELATSLYCGVLILGIFWTGAQFLKNFVFVRRRTVPRNLYEFHKFLHHIHHYQINFYGSSFKIYILPLLLPAIVYLVVQFVDTGRFFHLGAILPLLMLALYVRHDHQFLSQRLGAELKFLQNVEDRLQDQHSEAA